MGTWNVKIFSNAAACEVKDYFLLLYDNGLEADEIVTAVQQKVIINYELATDRNNALFALGFCLWEIKALSEDLLAEISGIITSGADLELLRAQGAEPSFLRQRAAHLERYLSKVSLPRFFARERIEPPVPCESPYQSGVCLAFKYPNGQWGGLVVINSGFYRNKGAMRVAMTQLCTMRKPTFADFETARMCDFRWERISSKPSRKYAAFGDQTGRFRTLELGYERNSQHERFFDYCGRFFAIVGQLPAFTQCLLTTTSGGDLFSGEYERFAGIMGEELYLWLDAAEEELLAPETLSQLGVLLHREPETAD